MELIDVQDLTITYKTDSGNLRALDHVNLSIDDNKLVAVVGESGCGKSTLALSIIGLLSRPPAIVESGAIEYKDVDLLAIDNKKLREYRGTEIAMIFQEPLTSLNPVFRVGDQIAEAIIIRDLRKAKHIADLPESDFMQKALQSGYAESFEASKISSKNSPGIEKANYRLSQTGEDWRP